MEISIIFNKDYSQQLVQNYINCGWVNTAAQMLSCAAQTRIQRNHAKSFELQQRAFKIQKLVTGYNKPVKK